MTLVPVAIYVKDAVGVEPSTTWVSTSKGTSFAFGWKIASTNGGYIVSKNELNMFVPMENIKWVNVETEAVVKK